MAAIIGIDADILFVKKSTVDAETLQGGIATAGIAVAGSGYNDTGDVITVTGGASQDVAATFSMLATAGVPDSITRIEVGSGYVIGDDAMGSTTLEHRRHRVDSVSK